MWNKRHFVRKQPLAVFRCDASVEIGSGHVYRCLTLADILRASGLQTLFVMRPHRGHLCDLVAHRGHSVTMLQSNITMVDRLDHTSWFGAPSDVDAKETAAILQDLGLTP